MAEINGLKDFIAAIEQSKRDLEAALPAIVAEAAQVIHDEIDIRLPRATGDLEKHLQTVAQSSDYHARATIQIADSSLGDVEQKAIFQEFGTSKAPAQPAFRPGFQAGKERAHAILAAGIAKVLFK